jgi:hypothetical protein
MKLVERITKSYLNWSIEPASELMTYAQKCDSYAEGSINSSEIQTAICEYMDQVASRSRALSSVLGRTKEPPMADVFTEATNMLVDAITRTNALAHLGISVSSEKNLKLPQGGYRKPDVSLWKEDKLVGVIECKTCLGRRRDDWQNDYEKRVEEFAALGLKSDALFLLVETEQTWCGFSPTDPRTAVSWFTLCPKGAWHGGGKTGESKLRDKQFPDVVEKFRVSLSKVLLRSS